MHVLIVTQYFWPENLRINDVAIGLKEKGYEVTILTGKPNYPSGRFFPGYGFWSKKESNRSRSQKILANLDIYGIKSPHGYETSFVTRDWGSHTS